MKTGTAVVAGVVVIGVVAGIAFAMAKPKPDPMNPAPKPNTPTKPPPKTPSATKPDAPSEDPPRLVLLLTIEAFEANGTLRRVPDYDENMQRASVHWMSDGSVYWKLDDYGGGDLPMRALDIGDAFDRLRAYFQPWQTALFSVSSTNEWPVKVIVNMAWRPDGQALIRRLTGAATDTVTFTEFVDPEDAYIAAIASLNGDLLRLGEPMLLPWEPAAITMDTEPSPAP